MILFEFFVSPLFNLFFVSFLVHLAQLWPHYSAFGPTLVHFAKFHLSDISDNVPLAVIGNLSAKTRVYRQFIGKNIFL